MVDMPKFQKVVIDGVDVSSYVMSFTVDETFGQEFRNASIGLKNTVNTLLSITDNSLIEKEVTIQRGVATSTEEYLFRGYVDNTNFQGAVVIVNCYDKLGLSRKTTINKSYDSNIDSSAGVLSEIFKDIVNNYVGLTATSASVQNSGSFLIRKKFVLRNATAYDALKQICDMIDFQMYYDPTDDLVYFEPKGYTTNANVLELGTNIIEVPQWNIDSTNLFNEIIIGGITQNINTSEGPILLNGVVDADWNTTSITLNNKLVTVQVYSDTSNPPTTEKKGGVVGASSSYDYSVDKDAKKIEWSSTFTPTTSYYAKVNYTYDIPSPVSRKNNASIAYFGKTITRSVFKDDLKLVEDVATWAQKQVNVYGFPFKSANLKVLGVTSINIGEVYKVVDGVNGVNDSFLVQKVTFKYPFRYDEVSVSDLTLRTAEWSMDDSQRLKRLEEKNSDNEDVLNSFIDVEQNLALRSQLDVNKASPDADTLYWDDDNQGTWDDYDWGTDTPETQTLSQRTHSNNIFFEDFWDDDHVDTGTTTATVSTTAHSVSFTAGQTFRSDTLFKYKTTLINTARISIPVASITGSTSLYLSNDAGSSWEATTNASTLTFATTGTDLRYRIDSAGAASIVFTNTFGESTPLKIEVNV